MKTDWKKKKKRNKKGIVSRSLRFVGRLLLVFFFGSILQVLVFKWLPPFFTPVMLVEKLEGMFEKERQYNLKYKWAPIEKISPYMVLAVIASEDQGFADHFGVDIKAIEKAMEDNKRGRRLRGGSTITQQVAKNLFLWQGRDYFRKALEAYYTVLIELFWSKQRIAEMYVNIAEMGYGIYGVQSASNIFYNKDAIALTRNEAALLAAVLPNPKRFSAKKPSEYIIGRRNWIVKQMYQIGDKKYLEKIGLD